MKVFSKFDSINRKYTMNLKEAILENQNYVDPDEGMYVVFAQKVNNAFEPPLMLVFYC
jgi:hypothetical protein